MQSFKFDGIGHHHPQAFIIEIFGISTLPLTLLESCGIIIFITISGLANDKLLGHV